MRLTGMSAFTTIWFGQLISILGSRMSSFVLIIWVWQETGQATGPALLALFRFLPTVILSPLAGVIIDRFDRKNLLLLTDSFTALATLVTLGLVITGSLEVWHLYALGAWSGIFDAAQTPAYSASISTLMPKSQYARANAMRSTASSLSTIAAPILAGILLALTNVSFILVLDLVTFLVALLTLTVVHIPTPKSGSNQGLSGVLNDMLYGFKFLLSHKTLLNLLLVFTAFNFAIAFTTVMLPPMILAKTGSNEVILGLVQAALGAGGIVGGIYLTIWGGPKKLIWGIFVGLIGGSLSMIALGASEGTIMWCVAAFLVMIFLPLVDASFGALNQKKVPLDVQGRVFASSRMIALLAAPVAMAVGGPLADHILEPIFVSEDSAFLGLIVGTGSGAGMSAIILLAGIFGLLVGLLAIASQSLRTIESALPEYDTSVLESEPTSA